MEDEGLMHSTDHYTSVPVQIFSGVFFLVFLLFLAKKTYSRKIDVSDFFFLSSIAVIPVFFILGKPLVFWVMNLLEVKLPFVFLFASLFFVVFVYLYKLIRRLHTAEKNLRSLSQEFAIHRFDLKNTSSLDP